MNRRTAFAIITAVALGTAVLHLTLGWEWTVVAGIGAGLYHPRLGWALGALGTAVSWTGMVVYTAAVDSASFRVLLDTLGGLAGNIPGEIFVGLTVLLGGLLGAIGGAIGGLVRPTFENRSPPVSGRRDGTDSAQRS